MLASPLRRVLAGAGALFALAAVWFALQYYPVGGSGREVLVTVHPGDSMAVISGELHQAGVLASPLAFRVLSALEGAPLVTPGVYEIRQGATFGSIRSTLSDLPNVPQVSVTPGLTLREIAATLAGDEGQSYATQFLAAAGAAAARSAYRPGASLEGLIGPGTYLLTPGLSPARLLAEMQTSFADEAGAAGLSPSSTLQGLNAYQLVIGASIVEKEGYYAKNMPDVARVILNRLARHMPLQMDSTVLYALGLDGGTVTPAMLRTPSPYNSYLNLGLTPTPICVVSATALSSMLHPPAGSWLYFVLIDKSGDMAFADTYAQQLANEARAAKAGV